MGSKYEIKCWGFDEEIGDYGYIKSETCDTWEEAYAKLEKYSKEYKFVALAVRTDAKGLI